MQARADSRPFASLSDEMDALGRAMYAPALVESDWSDRWGFPHYLAEATVFLPEYAPGKSKVRVYADGAIIGHHPEPPEQGGTATKIKHYVEKDKGVKTVTLQISYWPTSSFDKPYTLTVTIPERQAQQTSNDQTLPGP